jgi:fatty acid desaturase
MTTDIRSEPSLQRADHERSALPASGDYVELKRIVKSAGMLAPQTRYYLLKALILGALYAGTVALVVTVDQPAIVVLSAVLLGLMFTQVGFLGHDLAHRQITHNSRLVTWLGLVVGNLLIGVSYSWWTAKHNRHHAAPNHLDDDPDLQYSILAFNSASISSKPRVFYPVIAYQAVLYLFLGTLHAYSLKFRGFEQVATSRSPTRLAEGLAYVLHIALYILMLVQIGDWALAIAFLVVQQATFGLYNTLVFAPNHKGMPLLDDSSRMDYLREQVLTARNVIGHPVVDFLYGGLNYQIEHHLFPSMARNKLRATQPIVAKFCAERSIDYTVVGPIEGIAAPLRHLHAASAPLR